MSAATTETEPRVLDKRVDRCDRCGVDDLRQGLQAAKVRVVLNEGIIDLCGHHFTKHEGAIREQALEIVDERET